MSPPEGPRPARTPLSGVAAVTGAGSGIGRALAVQLAGKGCHLALADIDESGLGETVGACAGRGVKVTARVLDVADREAVFSWAESVVDEHGRVNLVFNNAGVSLVSTVGAMDRGDLDWLMGVNFFGVVNGTQAFLPHLEAAGRGHLVNMSSVFGLISVPGQSAYNASKFAVRGFTDALGMELEIRRSPVQASTVHPGGVKTNIVAHARIDPSSAEVGSQPDELRRNFHRIALTTPERAARQILSGVEKGRRRILVGPDAKAIDLLARLPAGLYRGLLVRGGRR